MKVLGLIGEEGEMGDGRQRCADPSKMATRPGLATPHAKRVYSCLRVDMGVKLA